MATKEDILEQIVEEYLIHQGYFVRHNVKFLPSAQHADFITNQELPSLLAAAKSEGVEILPVIVQPSAFELGVEVEPLSA